MAPHTADAIRSHYFFKWFIAAILLVLVILLVLGGSSHPQAASTTLDAITYLPETGQVAAEGAGAPGSKIAILANGDIIGEAVVDANGHWAYRTEKLPPGDYTFQIANAANQNEIIASRGITIPAPQVELSPPTLTAPSLGDDGSLYLSGSGHPGATLAIFANGKQIGETQVDADGKWSFDAGALEPGDYDFVVKTLDAHGNPVNEVTAKPFTIPAPAGSCIPYVIKPGDWLTKLAIKYLGGIDAYSDIVKATNAAAEQDDSFTVITDPDRIEPGQKICIPTK